MRAAERETLGLGAGPSAVKVEAGAATEKDPSSALVAVPRPVPDRWRLPYHREGAEAVLPAPMTAPDAKKRWNLWGNGKGPGADGKLNKKPHAESNQPEKWLSYAEAVAAAAKGGASGLGYQIRGSTRLVVLDLDHVVESWEETSGSVKLTPRGERLVESVGPEVYIEVSPSRHGLRVLARRPGLLDLTGDTLHKFKDTGEGVEVYTGASSRYATITGWALPGREGKFGVLPVAAITAIEAEGVVLKRASAAKSGSGEASTKRPGLPEVTNWQERFFPGDQWDKAPSEHKALLLGNILDGDRSSVVMSLIMTQLGRLTAEQVYQLLISAPGSRKYLSKHNDALAFAWQEITRGRRLVAKGREERKKNAADELIAAIDFEVGAVVSSPDELPIDFWTRPLWDAHLDRVGTDRVLNRIVELDVAGKQNIRAAWKEAREAFIAEEKSQRATVETQAAVDAGRTLVWFEGRKEEAIVAETEKALIEAGDPQFPLMRTADAYARPLLEQPEWAHGRDGQPVPTIAVLRAYDAAAMRWGIDRHVTFLGLTEKGNPRPIEQSGLVATWMLENPLPQAPRVRGLITAPLVREDGRLVEKPGLDPESALYLHLGGGLGEAIPGSKPPIEVPDDPAAAAKQAREIAAWLLSHYADYRFEDPDVDRAVALAARVAIFTRKDLDIAPGFLLVGPERGTGKTTLAAVDHVLATGHDIATSTLEEDTERAKQTLFAAFGSSPTALLIDNIEANSAYSCPVLSQALTKSTIKARRYYTQTDGTVNTNAQLYLTGNAVVLDEDLSTRVLSIRFSPERPQKWAHPDWLGYARSIREDVRIAVQFLQRACIRHGGDVKGVACRFPAWARRVRDPLLYAGLPDVGKRLLDGEETNPNKKADGGIVEELEARFGNKRFTAGEIATSVGAGDSFCSEEFTPLRNRLRERWPTALGKNGARALGDYFREFLRRWFAVDGRRLRLVETSAKGLTRWHVGVGDALE